MKCRICKHGEFHPGKETVMLHRGETIVIIKQVPAEICDVCGEYYLSEAITKKVLKIAEEAVKAGAEVEILRFAA